MRKPKVKIQAFVIYDMASEVYSKPFFSLTNGEAIRTFSDAVNHLDSPYNKHPADYTLFHIGAFDDSLGCLESTLPSNLGSAMTYLNDDGSLNPAARMEAVQ